MDNTLSDAEIEQFTRLFNAHLANVTEGGGDGDGDVSSTIDPVAELECFRAKTPQIHRQALDGLAENLRRQFHADQEAKRRATLYALLIQFPPFSISSDADQRRLRSTDARRRRLKHVRRFADRFATRSNVGVRPFFAALRRLLEAQSHDEQGRTMEWLLDDAVLMESGGEQFMRSAVWILKGVLHLSERRPADAQNPFKGEQQDGRQPASDDDFVRVWTMPAFLSNMECASLARAIPSHVLPSRGRGSRPVHAEHSLRLLSRTDEEQQSTQPPIDLPTGALRYAALNSPSRDSNYAGTWLQWLLSYFYPIFAT